MHECVGAQAAELCTEAVLQLLTTMGPCRRLAKLAQQHSIQLILAE